MWEGLAATLGGSRVNVEPLATTHEHDLYEAAQDMDWSLMPVDPSADAAVFHAWLGEALALAARGEQQPFAVLDAGTGRAIGSTRYLSLRPEHRGLEIGYTWHASSVWGTGVNVEAKLLLLEHAFERLGCLRVEFKTDAQNERSRAALLALPARFEGIFRKHMVVRDGELRDSAYYAITDDEWPNVKRELRRRLEAKARAE